MTTPNLQLPHITESQANKEITANLQADGLDDAMNAIVEITITGDYDLTNADYRDYALFKLVGNPGAGFTFRIPNEIKRKFGVLNLTPNNCIIEVEYEGTDAVTLTPGTATYLHSDGYDIIPYSAVAPGAISDTNTTEVSVYEAGVLVKNNVDTINFVGAQVYINSDGSIDVDVTTAGAGGGSTYPAYNVVVKDADFALTGADFNGNRVIKVNSASTVLCYVPDSMDPSEPLTIIQAGLGQVAFIEDGSGVTFETTGTDGTDGPRTRTKNSAVVILPDLSVDGDTFWLSGDLDQG